MDMRKGKRSFYVKDLLFRTFLIRRKNLIDFPGFIQRFNRSKQAFPILRADRDEIRAGGAVVIGFESGAPAVGHWSVKPKFLSWALESRQFSLTLTHVCRNTFVPMNASMSLRASSPIFLSMAPFLPMMMPLWLSFSQ